MKMNISKVEGAILIKRSLEMMFGSPEMLVSVTIGENDIEVELVDIVRWEESRVRNMIDDRIFHDHPTPTKLRDYR